VPSNSMPDDHRIELVRTLARIDQLIDQAKSAAADADNADDYQQAIAGLEEMQRARSRRKAIYANNDSPQATNRVVGGVGCCV
jgi:hypothetical protein